MKGLRLAPGVWLSCALILCLISSAVCTMLALSPPWLGLSFEAPPVSQGPLSIREVNSAGPSAGVVHPGDSLLSIEGNGHRVILKPTDIVEEPDAFGPWTEVEEFHRRQSAIVQAISAPTVTLGIQSPDGTVRQATITPQQRPLETLPLVFWLQLFFGIAGFLIGLWVWVLRPYDWGARMYALTGAMFPVFAHSAAIYSAREIALPGGLFWTLSSINRAGASLFGVALCGIFLCYPRMMVRPRTLLILFMIAIGWVVAGTLRLTPDQNWAGHIPTTLEMLGAIVIATVQWFRTKGDPAARTALRWFAIWVLVGAGTFITLTSVANLFGMLPPIPQGYAFGFFLLMYAGLAFGLRKYRLFDLDVWALRILFLGLAAVALVSVELILISVAGLGYSESLWFTLLLALAYLPVRHWLWDKFYRRETMPQHELFDAVLRVAFAQSDAERTSQWRSVLSKMFDPLHITEVHSRIPGDLQTSTHDENRHDRQFVSPPGHDAARGSADIRNVTLEEYGLAIVIPPVASSAALRLSHPWSGRKLFAPRHVQLAETIVRLMRSADESRQAFQQGVLRERSRIARDLHDDVSSPLLAGLFMTPDDQVRNDIRDALTQMRSIVSGVEGHPVPLEDLIADIRFENIKRLEKQQIAVEWPLPSVGDHVVLPEQRKMLASFHHEVFTNILKHAQATNVYVDIRMDDGTLSCRITDNGVGFTPTTVVLGQGLPNLQSRAASLNGTVTIAPATSGKGVVIHLVAPIGAG